jgi:alginate O-acetyltransferase complex protein AlgI
VHVAAAVKGSKSCYRHGEDPINLTLISFYKYVDFFASAVSQLAGHTWSNFGIILPLGISFFTFTQTAYLVDVYKGLPGERSITRYSLFVTVFPHLIAGPILHYQDIVRQFLQQSFGKINAESLSRGLTLFVIGLFKKVVLADSLAVFATTIFNAATHGTKLTYIDAWIGVISYTFQLYFDFSGYSDMAVGLGWIFCLNLPWNFDSPYKAINIRDFWRRWHITLSNFMKDYVYIPLGGNRCRPTRMYVNLLVTMGICGLWHGAGWTFVLWGLMHGAYMIVFNMWSSAIAWIKEKYSIIGERHRNTQLNKYIPNENVDDTMDLKPQNVIKRVMTLFAVMFAWVAFRSPNLDVAKEIWWAMIGGNGLFIPAFVLRKLSGIGSWFQHYGIVGNSVYVHSGIFTYSTPRQVLFWILISMIIIWVLPNSREWMEKRISIPRYFAKIGHKIGIDDLSWHPSWPWNAAVIFMTVASIMFMGRISEFLYFQF